MNNVIEAINNSIPTILIIDDDPANINILSDYFKDSNFSILVAEDSESGIFRADYAKPDIILLDILLPGIDGYETCRRIKKNHNTKDIPIIFISALTEVDHKIKAFKTGAVDYITKPFQREEVLARVNVHLKINELSAQLQRSNEKLENKVAERTQELIKANNNLKKEIAERKSAEESLRKSHEQLASTLDALPDILFEIDFKGNIINYHASSSEKLYLPPSFFLNKNISEVLPDDTTKIIFDAIKQAIESGYHRGSIYSLNMPDGLKWYELSISVRGNKENPDVQNSHPNNHLNNHLMVLVRDITERKEAEIELGNLQILLSNIINSMPSVLIGVDNNLEITHWNRQAESFRKIKLKEVIHKNLLAVMPFLIKYEDKIHSVMDSAKSELIYKQTFDNNKKFYNLYFSPLIYNNNITGLVIRIDDITEIELKEEQLRRSQKMETIGILSGGIAHDFNNILSALIGATCLLQFKADNNTITKETLKEDLDLINISINRAKKLVGDLMMLAKKNEVIMNIFDLNSAIKNVVGICSNTFDKSVEIKTSYSKEKAIVIGDQGQIEQVLLNLCINSLHAMTIMRKEGEKEGGILSVAIEKFISNEHFSGKEIEEKKYWLIKVSDTGVGMSKDIQAKIFDPFFSTKGKESGTGLGLLMVQNIVKEHNGIIEVSSEPKEGSTFSIYLPIHEINENIINKTEKNENIETGSGVILVIDDESFIRETTKKMLEKCGYTVYLAGDGEEGIEIYKEKRQEINLVLLDMSMPKISGKETYEEIKKINPNTKVIITSGYKLDNITSDTIKLDKTFFLQKPYSMVELSKKVKELIIIA